MGLDFDKLKQLQIKLNEEALKELYEDLPKNLIKFSNNNIINDCLYNCKSGIKDEHQTSTRVINSWLNQGVIKIKEEDKGKIRRFNRLENIWLNIVIEARKFGIPLESLTKARTQLLESPIRNFSLLKFGVIETLFKTPKMILITAEGNAKLISFDTYTKWMSKGMYPTHINLKLIDFIALEYPKNALSVDFKMQNLYEDKNKMKLLYFLKTGDYDHIKLHISDNDVRIIEDSNVLSKNQELMQIISDWNFKKVTIAINDGMETSINL
jgi:hypothetical protein